MMEDEIIGELVTNLLDEGYLIAVFDGQEYQCPMTDDADIIFTSIESISQPDLVVFDEARQRVGIVTLVHGRGYDIITHYSQALEYCIGPALDLCDEYSLAS